MNYNDAIFKTIDEAVCDIADFILQISVAVKSEFFIMIYLERSKNLYGYTYPVTDFNKTRVRVITGDFEAYFHSHCLTEKDKVYGMIPRPKRFSPGDKQLVVDTRKPLYMIEPTGTIRVLENNNVRIVRDRNKKPIIVR